MRNKTTKIALALGMLLLASQAQADQLADIKAAGVVKVATFDANPPFGVSSATTLTLPRRWRKRSASNSSWWPPTRPTVFRCCSPAKPT